MQAAEGNLTLGYYVSGPREGEGRGGRAGTAHGGE